MAVGVGSKFIEAVVILLCFLHCSIHDFFFPWKVIFLKISPYSFTCGWTTSCFSHLPFYSSFSISLCFLYSFLSLQSFCSSFCSYCTSSVELWRHWKTWRKKRPWALELFSNNFFLQVLLSWNLNLDSM